MRESSQMSAKVSSSPISASTSSWSSRGRRLTKVVVLRQQGACALATDVVTGDQRAKFVERCAGLGAHVRIIASRLGAELNSWRGFGCCTFAGLVEAQQRGARIDLTVDDGIDLTNPSRGWCAQCGLHLHAFQHDQRGTGLDLVADRDRHGDDDGRRGGADQAGFVLADPVTYAVHLDEEPGGARDGDDLEAMVAEGQPTLVFTEPFDLDDEIAAITDDAVAARTDLPDREARRPGPGS